MPPSPSPILYQSADSLTFLIDIPTSISSAQFLPGQIPSKTLISCEPRDEPYPSTEPKSPAALAKVRAQHAEDEELHKLYCDLANSALRRIREEYGQERDFCLPRVTVPCLETGTRKRRRVEVETVVVNGESGPLSQGKCEEIRNVRSASSAGHIWSAWLCTVDQETYSSQADQDVDGSLLEINGSAFHHNYRAIAQDYSFEEQNTTSSPETAQPITFILPPRSAFLLSSLSSVSTFRDHARQLMSNSSSPTSSKGRFPFILLDPPWSNRSATRKSSYATTSSLGGLKALLLCADLDMHIANDGFVAIWVTNRASCRDLVLGPNGLFDAWGLELVEEWIWLKVSRKGQPLTAMDGVWRKPYEVCLIGTKSPFYATRERIASKLTRRVIVGVPDLHSRKPCLKKLVEDLLLPSMKIHTDIWGLEIFARYCVTGWLAWGDEAVLFNRSNWWRT